MSNDRIATYIRSTLLPAGFSIIDGDLAHRLSAGLWPSVNNAMTDFVDKAAIISRFGGGCHVFTARCEGRSVILVTRSVENLAERIALVTGLVVDAIAPYESEATKAITSSAVLTASADRINRQLRKELRIQKAAIADEQRRRDALVKGQDHRQWLEQRRVDAENSRQEFFEKKRGGHG